MKEQIDAFRAAARDCYETFEKPEHKAQLGHLRPPFLAALLDLQFHAVDGNLAELEAAFLAGRKRIGDPKAFGYGTPCGDALKTLYGTYGELQTAKRAAAVQT